MSSGIEPVTVMAQLTRDEVERLRAWLERPSGSFVAGRVTVDAVEGGQVLVRIRRYQYGDRP